MDIERASKIMKSFVKDNEKLKPTSGNDWEFNVVDKRIRLVSNDNNIDLDFSSKEDYLDIFIFGNDYKIEDNKLIENYYLTSVGLITEEEYHEAEWNMDCFSAGLKEDDLIKEDYYVSNKGINYIYLGKIEIDNILLDRKKDELRKETILTDSYCFNLNTKKLVKTKSVKLIWDSEIVNLDELYTVHLVVEDETNEILESVFKETKNVSFISDYMTNPDIGGYDSINIANFRDSEDDVLKLTKKEKIGTKTYIEQIYGRDVDMKQLYEMIQSNVLSDVQINDLISSLAGYDR